MERGMEAWRGRDGTGGGNRRWLKGDGDGRPVVGRYDGSDDEVGRMTTRYKDDSSSGTGLWSRPLSSRQVDGRWSVVGGHVA